MENPPTIAAPALDQKQKYQSYEDLPDEEFSIAREAVDSAILDTACVLLFMDWQKDEDKGTYKARSAAPLLKVKGDWPEGKYKEFEMIYQAFCAGVEYSKGIVPDLWESIRP